MTTQLTKNAAPPPNDTALIQHKDNLYFSHFKPPIENTKPDRNMSLSEISEIVKSDKLKAKSQIVRAGNKEVKKQIEYVTPSGIFSKRNDSSIIQYSGIVCIDLDHCANEPNIEAIKDTIAGDTFLNPSLIFVSPSGDGLKVFVSVAGAVQSKHEMYYQAISKYLKDTYQLNADPSCRNISRACILAYDPNVFYDGSGSVESNELLSILKETQPTVSKFEANDTLITQLAKMPEVVQHSKQALKNNGWRQKGDKWTRSGKALKDGNSAVYNYSEVKGVHIFTNYSDNTIHFANKGYNAVSLICKLEYNDNITECLKDLFEKYLAVSEHKTPQKKQTQEPGINESYFKIRNIAELMKEGAAAPERRRIFDGFLYEDTNTYFFSRTNYGKSILTFQIGYCAATGQQIGSMVNECEPMRVLVADMEMDAYTLYKRHSKAMKNADPELLKNLLYLHEDPAAKPAFGFDLLALIEKAAIQHKAKLIILDNISKVIPDLLKAEDVARVIEFMKRIRQNTGASFLVIGHTTKGSERTCINSQSYYGSAAIQNFFPEIFYLDATKMGKFFLCHAKTKREHQYITTVPVFNRGFTDTWGLGFEYECLHPVNDIQLPISVTTRPERKVNLSQFRKELKLMEQSGIKQATIAKMCNSSRQNISKILGSP